jgi:hypothetical protein
MVVTYAPDWSRLTISPSSNLELKLLVAALLDRWLKRGIGGKTQPFYSLPAAEPASAAI